MDIHRSVLEKWRIQLLQRWDDLEFILADNDGTGSVDYNVISGGKSTVIPPYFMYKWMWMGKRGPLSFNWMQDDLDASELLGMIDILDEQLMMWSSDFDTIESELYNEIAFYAELIRILISLIN